MTCRSLTLGSLLVLLVAPTTIKAQETVRHFPAYHCSYTLPGKGWTWLESPDEKALFLAERDDGIRVVLGVTKAPRSTRFDSKFLTEAKKAFIIPGKTEFRNEQTLEFRGLPCYQIGCKMPDGSTTVSRAFLAHGFYYHLGIVGDVDPVESRPDLESIMSGFEFDTPPQISDSTSDDASDDTTDRRSGQLVGYGLLALLILGIIHSRMNRRQKLRR